MRTYTYSQIAHIALPILVSTLMEQLIGTTDTAFLGRVGDIELGASAIGGILFIVVFMLGLGFSIGAQILMARRNGEGNYQRIGVIFYHSIAFLLLLGVVLFVLVRAFSPHILQRIIQSPRVCEAATTYLHWRIIGMFFAFVNVMFRAFYVATTHTRTLTLNSVVMVLSNVCFNYVLIFGHFGVPALGIAGAAIGSSMAEGVSTIFFIIHTRRHIPSASTASTVCRVCACRSWARYSTSAFGPWCKTSCRFPHGSSFPQHRTFGRGLFGSHQHHTQHFVVHLYDSGSLCLHSWHTGQQPYGAG